MPWKLKRGMWRRVGRKWSKRKGEGEEEGVRGEGRRAGEEEE